MAKERSIIYVNYSPYENAGRIFDYLLDRYQLVVLFSLGFHKLGQNHKSNVIHIYKKGSLINSYPLYQVAGPKSLVFLFLPIKSFLVLIQILYHSYKMRLKYGQFNYYFTVNAFTAWIGNLLRKMKVVKKTTFWVWDYYPPIHKNKLITFIRLLYWQFDKRGSDSNQIVFLNQRLIDLRKDIGILVKNKKYNLVPIGTKPVEKSRTKNTKPLKMVFFGVLKQSQGLDLLLDTARKYRLNNTELHVIGSGPDDGHFRGKCKKSTLKVKFWGYVKEDKKIDEIISSCDIGIATYLPEERNVSYYGDPSKIKQYLSLALPVITTNVFVFSQEIKKYKAGVIINYNKKELITAINTIKANYNLYSRNALNLGKKYDYKTIYKPLFQ